MNAIVELGDLDATAALGWRLAQRLFPGAVIGLIGPLGAGKTQLVRAIAKGLDIADSRIVTSPTFGLIHEYKARLPIYHFDVYRLKSLEEFRDLGVHEYFDGAGVCLIEWADRVAECLPRERLEIALEITGETTRRATLRAYGQKYADVLANLN
jgi:tRNA threonylcarbamoyladenosine biosynthesis protein TsaE